MIKSMTGFGRGECISDIYRVVVEIKSINHRYLDITVKMPGKYRFAEEIIKSDVKNKIKRGKVEVSVSVEMKSGEDVDVKLNSALAKKYCENIYRIEDELGIPGEIDINSFCRLPEIFTVVQVREKEEEFINVLGIATEEALENIDRMRQNEGDSLTRDIRYRVEYINRTIDGIDEHAPQVAKKYIDKLRSRIVELIGNEVEIPQDRILLEAAIFADKSNITEEIVRLRSHTKQLLDIISSATEPEGRKLDFLMQEMNRESNTIGSKANDINITDKVLNLKSEIEKIREQVQNIE